MLKNNLFSNINSWFFLIFKTAEEWVWNKMHRHQFKLQKLMEDIRFLKKTKKSFKNWKIKAATSKGYFTKCHFPNVLFPKRLAPSPALAAALGPLACSSRSAWPLARPSRSAQSCCSLQRLWRTNPTFGKLLLGFSLGMSPLGEMSLWNIYLS